MTYPIGTPGKPWGQQEKQQWLEKQHVKRSYEDEVLSKVLPLSEQFELLHYGALPYDETRYPLYALKSLNWRDDLPCVLVTGGVHGYETSGVQGAIRFAQTAATDYQTTANLLIVPCISPWGYETINRWNPDAVDPNRSFTDDSPSPEARLVMQLVKQMDVVWLAHFDLHETTDTDNSEFRPALAARDGTVHDNWNIPDGFYTVDDSNRANPAFQTAIIRSVEKVTHIAPPDENGKIIGAPIEQNGVINYDKVALKLCGGFTNATSVTTTEVYPDSASATPENCIDAQVAAVVGGLNFLLR